MNIDFVTEQLVKEIALSQFRVDNNVTGADTSRIPSIEQASEDAYKIVRELFQLTDGEVYQKVFDLDGKLSDLSYAESEGNFVNGFVRGYFFLKQILESNGQAFA
ncbi:hypothetical protein M5X06_28435 [Paenibacillus alvei]|uniref:Uncharacterized protein n=1 Tax=Paenibacillus alvei TaxID=44250 RepID=A0ABT4H871_PAEAL|nr:hypothetical protein [Paenibacillus alvei]MCY9764802.1 hypothetical protein [Paenibacillus alvei]MCY9770709.1 hypothetical protein [Paenibacillus alvei]